MVATLYPRSPQPTSDIYFELLGLPRRASCSIWRDRPFRRSCPQARQPNYEGPPSSSQIFHPIHHYRHPNPIRPSSPAPSILRGFGPSAQKRVSSPNLSTSHLVRTPSRSPPNR